MIYFIILLLDIKSSESFLEMAQIINEYLINVFTIQMIQHFDNCLDIKGLIFFTK